MADEHRGRGYTIGDVSALYDLPASTLRWWEKQGVLPAPPRTSDQRVYDEQALSRIGLAYLCCVIGRMPLAAAAVITSGQPGNAEWQRTLSDQIDRIERQVTELEHAKNYLDRLRRCPDDDPITQCPYLAKEILDHTPLGRSPAHSHTGSGCAGPTHGPCCRACGGELPPPKRGRRREYCSPRCRQRAYRQRVSG
ncbi:MerR family transcriptional regulator [Nocardia sp. AG03]|uniref:MerR family transcriptional regulator n=1 Tax=Nocardia sp. AG03 TaxID=3025312 RepID=UPI0024188148|nr:MerR family transcriptional regulator [Nocardia sp. AG03]